VFAVLVRERFFVGGTWVEPTAGGTIEVVNPATEEPFATVPAGTAADVDRAVAAARAALDGWSATAPAERGALLARMAEGIIARMGEVGSLIAQEVGMPVGWATLIQGGASALVTRTYGELVAGYRFEERDGPSLLVRRPLGVAGCVTPWNFPLYVAVSKVAAALAAGCTAVVKPSELAPLTAFLLADVAEEAGAPPGVLNVVSGLGPEAGEALVVHPGVDVVSFTGSTQTGRRVAVLAGRALKPTVLELGGKSASVVLDDADLDEAVEATVRQSFLNSGQTCLAWTRLLVPAARHDEAARVAAKVADSLTVGDPEAGEADLGPLRTAAQREAVWRAIEAAEAEGATVVAGGTGPPDGLDRGWYARPTVLAGVRPHMAVAREEVFGPVLAILAHEGDDDAVRIANATGYGLHGAVFSGDRERAAAVARRLRTGQVDLGGAGYNPRAPIGGFGRSGWGRELGVAGLEAFLGLTSIQLP
jgi:acyl-CoA reductase-like NAD-dependent aldehyde dehydrogenase